MSTRKDALSDLTKACTSVPAVNLLISKCSEKLACIFEARQREIPLYCQDLKVLHDRFASKTLPELYRKTEEIFEKQMSKIAHFYHSPKAWTIKTNFIEEYLPSLRCSRLAHLKSVDPCAFRDDLSTHHLC